MSGKLFRTSGSPVAQAGQAPGGPFCPGSVSCTSFSFSAFTHWGCYSRFRVRMPEMGECVRERGLPFHLLVQWDAGQGVWGGGSLSHSPLRTSLSRHPSQLPFLPLPQKVSPVAQPWSVAPQCCKMAEREWDQRWPVWIWSAATEMQIVVVHIRGVSWSWVNLHHRIGRRNQNNSEREISLEGLLVYF